MNSASISPRATGRSRSAAGVVLAAAAVGGSLATSAPAGAAESHTVIAHRGDRTAAPENTLSAFKSAIAKGVDAIEMDVAFSRTGYPVVIHDLTLDRTTNCSGKVSSKSVTQMNKCDAGSWFSSAYKGERIPTLWDAMKYINRTSSTTRVILHMKVTPTPAQAKITMQRVNLNGMANRAIILASNPTSMSRMKAAGAKKQAFIFNSVAGWDHKYKIMVPYAIPLDARKVRAAHARGAKVWAVENHPLSLTRLVNLTVPVDGVLVDRLRPSAIDLLRGVVRPVVKAPVAPPVVQAPAAPPVVKAPEAPPVVDAAPTPAETVETQSFSGPTAAEIEADRQERALEMQLDAAEAAAEAELAEAGLVQEGDLS